MFRAPRSRAWSSGQSNDTGCNLTWSPLLCQTLHDVNAVPIAYRLLAATYPRDSGPENASPDRNAALLQRSESGAVCIRTKPSLSERGAACVPRRPAMHAAHHVVDVAARNHSSHESAPILFREDTVRKHPEHDRVPQSRNQTKSERVEKFTRIDFFFLFLFFQFPTDARPDVRRFALPCVFGDSRGGATRLQATPGDDMPPTPGSSATRCCAQDVRPLAMAAGLRAWPREGA